MRKYLKFFITLSIIFLYSCRGDKVADPLITIPELKEHIEYLASDELGGRLPGTDGDIKSAEYIRDLLGSWGLEPTVDNGMQSFEIVASVEAGKNNK